MQTQDSLFSSLKASALHLLISLAVILVVATLVFGFWYRPPFNQVQGGFALFALIAAADVICGPLLTLVIWNPRKSHREKISDLSFVAIIQMIALAYGLYSVALARPIYVVYERDRFRVVSPADLRGIDMVTVPNYMQSYSWTGPKIIGVELYDGSHPKFLESVQLSMAGIFPAYQPTRWVDYSFVQREAGIRSRPLVGAANTQVIDEKQVISLVQKTGIPSKHMGYLPLSGFIDSNWSVIVDQRDGHFLGYLPFDGWQHASHDKAN